MAITESYNPNKWTSLSNPGIWKYVRKDIEFTAIVDGGLVNGAQTSRLTVESIVDASFDAGDTVYVSFNLNESLNGTYLLMHVTRAATSYLYINLAYSQIGSTDTGWSNNTTGRYGHSLHVLLTDGLGPNPRTVSQAHFSGMINEETGLYEIDVDITKMAVSLFSKNNCSDYDEFVISETNLCKGYRFKIGEVWARMSNQGIGVSYSAWQPSASHFFIVAAAMQLKHKWGGGLDQYMVAYNKEHTGKLGKFLTAFDVPVYVTGMPFDLSIIYDGEECQAGVDTLYLIEQDLSENQLSRTVIDSKLSESVIRLSLDESNYASLRKAQVKILVDTAGTERNGSEVKTIKIVQYDCLDNVVYLAWINPWGGWDYWAFHKTQRESVGVDYDEYEMQILDYESSEGFSDRVNINAFKILKLGVVSLNNSEVNGISTMLRSPRVLMLHNISEYYENRLSSPTTIPQWVIVKPVNGTYIVKESTFESLFTIEIDITTQPINIQNF